MSILLAVVLLLAVGLAFSTVYMRPRRFWPLVLGASVVTSGVVLNQASFLDEITVGAAVLALAMRPPSPPTRSVSHDWFERAGGHLWLFLLTSLYMIGESLRGIGATHDLAKIRWVLFFGLVAALAALLVRRGSLPARGETAVLLCRAGVVYFSAYITVGAVTAFTGGSRYDIQNVYWGGTTYAAFVLVAVVPAAIYLLRPENADSRRLGWLTIAAAILQAFYFDSRVSWVALIVFMAAGIRVLGMRRTALFAGGFAVALWIALTFLWPSYYSTGVFAQVLTKPFEVVFGDVDTSDFSTFSRYAHTQVGFEVISDEPHLLLVGTGFRASSELVGPALAEYYNAHGFGAYASSVKDQESTIGFSTLFIEIGVIGVALYLANIGAAARMILRSDRTPYRYVLLASLGLTVLWMMVTNPIDILLLHLVIMPSGVLALLGSTGGRQRDEFVPVRARESECAP